MEGKTSIAVAHRISTIKNADEIFVFHNGNIVERGAYGALSRAKTMFSRLESGLDLDTLD